MNAFSRPPRRNRPAADAPAASDAFLSGASAAVIVPASSSSSVEADGAATSPEREIHGQTIRFTDREKAALVRLARHHRRSENFIVKDLLRPALLRAAAELDGAAE